ncbi:MAG: hypothetical protein Q8K68_03305, partial [Nitrospirota bacterium]|nr:hypothetical protein [Nitrospirota bacterium]
MMTDQGREQENKAERALNGWNFKLCAYVAAAGWTLIAAVSLVVSIFHYKTDIAELARTAARTSYQKDVLGRLWNADHGGVYVEVRGDTQPNPYLAHIPERDITTPSGRTLTLL